MTDKARSRLLRSLITLRLEGHGSDSEVARELVESVGTLSHEDLTKIAGLGVAMTCNMVQLLSEASGLGVEETWLRAIDTCRVRGYPGTEV